MAEPNRENIRAWVDALRSGEYKQGEGRLRAEDDRRCCLGVACDLAVKAGVVKEKYVDRTWYFGPDDDWSALPEVVAEWLGMDDVDPYVHTGEYLNGEETLIDLNDVHEVSFAEIADLIEAEWLTPAEAGESS